MNKQTALATLLTSVLATGAYATEYEDTMSREHTYKTQQPSETHPGKVIGNSAEAMEEATTNRAMGDNSNRTMADGATEKRMSDGRGMDTAPMIVLVPHVFAHDPMLADGCWARLYDGTNYQGEMLSLVGPVNVAGPGVGTSFALGRKYDSVMVGPKATLAVFDNKDYMQKTASFSSGQSVADLDEKMGFFENIRSLKLSCSADRADAMN